MQLIKCSPKSAAFFWPTPFTCSSLSSVDGRRRAMSRSVASLKTMYAGTLRCVACQICEKECPPQCIYIVMERDEKGKALRRPKVFDLDISVCMSCQICVEVCPFDALFWSPEYEYSEPKIADLLHDKEKLGEWMETVPEAPELEAGAQKK